MSSNDAKTPRGARRRQDRYVVLVSLVGGAGVASCTTEDVDWQDAGDGAVAIPPDGSGRGSTMDVGSPPMCPIGPPATWCETPVSVSAAIIADFTAPAGGIPPVFGVYGAPVWGGVYAYPGAVADPCIDAALPPYPIVSEMRDNHWRITGTLGTYSGFGLWWSCSVGGTLYPVCAIDLSTFSGIRFSIQGDTPAGTLVLQMRTANDTPASTDPSLSSCGTCMGACAFASKTIAVMSTRATVTVPWTELAGGAPHPFDPRRVTGIEWQFSYPGMGTFPADLAVDDIELVR